MNDGSTDSSLDILHKYKATYANIKILTQTNKDVCIARNERLDIACGDYIWFIDADDLIKENIIEQITQQLNAYKSDMLTVGSYTFIEKFTASIVLH